MTRSTIRAIFYATALGLIVQYAMVGLLGAQYDSEPWPAIVLPGFKTVYGTSDTLTIRQVEVTVYFDNGQSSVSPPAFLAMMPRSHSTAFFRAQCAPSDDTTPSGVPPCQMPDGQRWFVERAQALFPEHPVRGVDVVWSYLHFVPADHSTSRTPIDTLQIYSPTAV